MNLVDLPNLLLNDITSENDTSPRTPSGKDTWGAMVTNLQQMTRASDWVKLRNVCIDTISTEGKDLRIAIYLATALAGTDGIAGFAQGLAMIHLLLQRYWVDLYPRDSRTRLYKLEWLAPQPDTDELKLFGLLQRSTQGQSNPPAGVEAPTVGKYDPAFAAKNAETFKAVTEAMDHLRAIAAFMGRPDRAGATPNFSTILALLEDIRQELSDRMPGKRVDTSSGAMAPQESSADGSASVHSDSEAVQALDRVSEYFRRTQPSSPIPHLLERAKRWVGLGFLDLVGDLASPETRDNVNKILGAKLPDKK